MQVIHQADTVRFWEVYEASHRYHPRDLLTWERTLLNRDAPNLYLPQSAITEDTTLYADDTLHINAAVTSWHAQDGIIAALRDAIAESETLISGVRDEARRHEYRATLREYMGHGDDCWSLALREELMRADMALRSLPTDTAAQYAERPPAPRTGTRRDGLDVAAARRHGVGGPRHAPGGVRSGEGTLGLGMALAKGRPLRTGGSVPPAHRRRRRREELQPHRQRGRQNLRLRRPPSD